MLQPLLGPLMKVGVGDGGKFIVEYPWPEGICDSWPGATFEMREWKPTPS